jgi:hypothetical protein
VENAQGKLQPGNFVTVRLLLGQHNAAPADPKEAIISQGQKSYLYVIRDTQNKGNMILGKAYQIEVQKVYEDKQCYEIHSSIFPKCDFETWIVVEGQLNLKEGALVEVVLQK